MEFLALALWFLFNAAACMTFWSMLEKVAKRRAASQVVSYIALSTCFVLLASLGVWLVWVVGMPRGEGGMGFGFFTLAGSALLVPLMLVVGVVRLVLLNKLKPEIL